MLKYGIILDRLVNFKLVKKRDELELRNVNNKYLIEHEIVIEEKFFKLYCYRHRERRKICSMYFEKWFYI